MSETVQPPPTSDADSRSGLPAQGDSSLPTPRLPTVAAVEHGGPDFAELAALGLSPEGLLDFSVNRNPLGASPRALQALTLVDPAAYPDTACLRLRGALAASHDVRPDEILVGNGSVELIWLLAQTYLAPGDAALIVGPTFGEYAAAVRRQGCEPAEITVTEADGFQPDVEEIRHRIRRIRPRLVYLCNPNNPPCQALDLADIARIAESLTDGLLVLDEAYLDLADGVTSALPVRAAHRRLVVLRSLTKSHALAGLRLGYMVADPLVVGAVGGARPPWTVNALAQAAGLAALGDERHVEAGRRLARRAKATLVDGMERLGLRCVPSRTSYWLVDVGNGRLIRDALLRRGILVRDATSFGLPSYIRVAARPLDDCERLLGALRWLVSSGTLSSREDR